jgi:hypothetical protein
MCESEGDNPPVVVVDPLLVPEDPLVVVVVPPLDVPDEVPLVVLDVLSGTCAHAEFEGAEVPALL